MKKIIKALGWKFDETEEMYKVLTPDAGTTMYFSRKLIKFLDALHLSTIPLCLDIQGFMKLAADWDRHVSNIPDDHFIYVVIPYLSKRMELGI